MCFILSIISQDNVKDLQVSLFQALILLIFNERDNLAFEDIRSETGIGA